jgi:GGDEF domain-containing protein
MWYRYVEGKDDALRTELASIVERESVESSRLEGISKQFFPDAAESDLQKRAADVLEAEIAALQSVLEAQSTAGKDFHAAIHSTNQSLSTQSFSADELQSCVQDVLDSNAKMHARLAETELKLAASQQHINSLRRELLDSQKAMLTDELGQAIQMFFAEKKLVLQNSGTHVGKLTSSVGVAVLRKDDDRLSWFERADKLLYSAKKAGKNRVMSERAIR